MPRYSNALRRPYLALVAGAAVTLGCGSSNGTSPIAPPTVTSVAPVVGTVGTELTITGTNFQAPMKVNVGSFAADSVQVANPTTLYALVPSGVTAGTSYDVQVDNGSGTAKGPNQFMAVAPTLSYVNGATKPSGNPGSTVILEGDAFGDHQGTGAVLFSDGAGGTIAATIANAGDWTNTFIVTTLPSGAGTGPVSVRTGTGTSDSLTFTVTSNATFSPSTIGWTSTTALPVGLSGHAAVYANVGSQNLVYVIGGADSTNAPRSDVLYAPVQTSGQLGSWSAITSLPSAVAFEAAVAATPANSRVKNAAGYLYVIGGATDSAGTPTATIMRGTLDSLGAVTSWTTLTTSLPEPLHSLGAVIFRGDLYVTGGATSANQPASAVYRTRIDSTGALGSWQSEPSLPFARAYAPLTQFGGYLYVWGGDSATVAPNDGNYTTNGSKLNQVAYAKIDLRTGDLTGSWVVNSASLTKAVAKHTAVVAGGTVLITGGLYNGAATGSSEESYAQINSDGTVGSFNGATGSHTIGSAGGGNLFNQAALAYVDASGVAHVLVIGGDDVNTPGAKHKQVWYY